MGNHNINKLKIEGYLYILQSNILIKKLPKVSIKIIYITYKNEDLKEVTDSAKQITIRKVY